LPIFSAAAHLDFCIFVEKKLIFSISFDIHLACGFLYTYFCVSDKFLLVRKFKVSVLELVLRQAREKYFDRLSTSNHGNV